MLNGLILSILLQLFSTLENRNVILIIEDCTGWKKITNGLKYPENFILNKDNPREESVSLGHAWFHPDFKEWITIFDFLPPFFTPKFQIL